MELKENTVFIYILLQNGLNCTFMELKESTQWGNTDDANGLNCTFMELKVLMVNASSVMLKALIVPLWN